MFEFKRLHEKSLGAAIKKAEHYRLLNEPRQAESICLDVLEVDGDHQQALVLLLLARTDQFVKEAGARVADARELLPRLKGEYERLYYSGIICERWAKAQLSRHLPRSGQMAYEWLREAMHWYEKAEALAPEGNDDTRLRWNACARLIMNHGHIRPATADDFTPLLE